MRRFFFEKKMNDRYLKIDNFIIPTSLYQEFINNETFENLKYYSSSIMKIINSTIKEFIF